jgi:hypothetical protein
MHYALPPARKSPPRIRSCCDDRQNPPFQLLSATLDEDVGVIAGADVL